MADDPKAAADGEATDAPPPEKKSKLPLLIGLAAGVALGAGGAAGYFIFAAAPPPEPVEVVEHVEPEVVEDEPKDLVFAKMERLSAPLIDAKGRVRGYVHLNLMLAVDGSDDQSFVRLRDPMLRHAANAVLAKKGVSAPDNPTKIDFDGTAALLRDTFNQTLGRPVVLSVRVVQAVRL